MKTIATFLRRWGWLGAILLWTLLFLFYALAYRYHFFWQEQNQLFLCSTDWIVCYLDKPAWLACLVGDYLTQFYYYLLAGPAILSTCIVLTLTLLALSLRSQRLWVILPILVFCTLWIVGSSMSVDYRLSQVFSAMGGIALFLAARPMRNYGVMAIPLAFWLFGYGALLTALLICIDSWPRGSKSRKYVIIASLALVLGIPALLMHHYLLNYGKCLAYPGIGLPIAPMTDLEQTWAVEHEYYLGNHQVAIANAKKTTAPNEVTSLYYYLATAQQGALPDSLLYYPLKDLGTLHEIGETTPLPIIGIMPDLYYALGDMMYAERAAMMANVFSPHNRNVRHIKRLAEANLVSRDTAAALKYLGLLAQTSVHKQWAADRMPHHMRADIEHEILQRRQLTNCCDTMRLGDNCRTILLELLNTNPQNFVALDYLLCTDLLLKQIDSFKADYDRYCMDAGNPRIKPLYQQALMIYLAGTNAPESEWRRYIALPDQLDRFVQYNKRRGDPAFADTYWYYFDKTK